MSTVLTTMNIGEWNSGQASPHITVNEALAALAVVAFKGVVSQGDTTPPGSPAEGDGYILGASPTGAWSAFAQHSIAFYVNAAWRELVPLDGCRTWVEDVRRLVRFDSGAGAWATELSKSSFGLGTVASGTLTPADADGGFQSYINGGAHTLAPPTTDAVIHLQMTNNASAGALTTTGFTKVTGDTLTTTDGDDFFLEISRNNGFSRLNVVALQ